MTIQRRFAPISGRFETESLAGLTGIYIMRLGRLDRDFMNARIVIFRHL